MNTVKWNPTFTQRKVAMMAENVCCGTEFGTLKISGVFCMDRRTKKRYR
jgi:hypothetical protein